MTPIKAATLHGLWQKVWLDAIDRQRAIEQAIENAECDFTFDEWRDRYMKFIKHRKSRVMDQMRKMDKNGSGFITNETFIKHMLDSNFRTTEREMKEVSSTGYYNQPTDFRLLNFSTSMTMGELTTTSSYRR